jgi:phosphoribosyl-AMP cyclohydrolase
MKFDTSSLTFNDDGLIPAIAVDAESGAVLMLAWMNRESLEQTIATGRVTYWSRSRGQLWRKGDTSGHTQELVDLYVDCDDDTLMLKVKQVGAACHTGEKTCFFTKIHL